RAEEHVGYAALLHAFYWYLGGRWLLSNSDITKGSTDWHAKGDWHFYRHDCTVSSCPNYCYQCLWCRGWGAWIVASLIELSTDVADCLYRQRCGVGCGVTSDYRPIGGHCL